MARAALPDRARRVCLGVMARCGGASMTKNGSSTMDEMRMRAQRRSIATLPLQTPTTSMLSMTYAERRRCSSTRNRRAHQRPAQHLGFSRRAAEHEALHGAPHRRRGQPLGHGIHPRYDGRPSYSVSVMEFPDGKVARETQYFADPFEPGPSRARWVERMGRNGRGRAARACAGPGRAAHRYR
jgi:hypothetical protein